jgi:hypothetical protein
MGKTQTWAPPEIFFQGKNQQICLQTNVIPFKTFSGIAHYLWSTAI